MNDNAYRVRAERGEVQIGTWVTMTCSCGCYSGFFAARSRSRSKWASVRSRSSRRTVPPHTVPAPRGRPPRPEPEAVRIVAHDVVQQRDGTGDDVLVVRVVEDASSPSARAWR